MEFRGFVLIFSVVPIYLAWIYSQYLLYGDLNSMAQQEDLFLPADIKPINYNVLLKPDFEDFTFFGKESIDVEIIKKTKKIILHCLDIKFDVASVVIDGETKFKTSSVEFFEERQVVELNFDSELTLGKALLVIEFKGELNDKMAGFYRSKYEYKGEDKWMATTQFEATDCRRAFPSFDEPALKATFEISLEVPNSMIALSNMNPKKDFRHLNVKSEESGTKIIEFEKTPVMSTYLVAFCIGDFEFIETKTTDGITVRVYTPPGKVEGGRFALECAAKILTYFSEYFDIKFPLEKSDLIAIPDFAAGAMENWGLVTYRETAILLDPNNAGITSKQRISYVVAHELAHQWFGNLVTMQWWEDIWLNEGFATFIGTQAQDYLFPEWDSFTEYFSQYYQTALKLDGLHTSHKITISVTTAAEINEIFDPISYNKGCCVLRMIADRLGADSFRNGLRIYLKKHQYSNAKTIDLWNSLSEASGVDVNQLMNVWTSQVGYPVISIDSQGDGKILLSQERYLTSGEKEASVWPLSLSVLTNKGVQNVELNETQTVVQLEGDWFKFNYKQSLFARCKYSNELLDSLVTAVQQGKLESPIDRLGIQDDLFALAKAGHIEITQVFSLLKAYKGETDKTVWTSIAANLGDLAIILSTQKNYENFQKFVIELYTEIGSKLGFDEKESDSDLDKLLRISVLSQLGTNGDKKAISYVKDTFDGYLNHNKTLADDLQRVLFRILVKYGGVEEYEEILKIYRNDPLQTHKVMALAALASSNNEDLILRTLNWTLNSGEVREQDFLYVFAYSGFGKLSRDVAWKFMKENWERLTTKIGENLGLLARIVQYATDNFATQDMYDDIEQFFIEHDTPAAKRTISQSLEGIKINISWLDRISKEIDLSTL